MVCHLAFCVETGGFVLIFRHFRAKGKKFDTLEMVAVGDGFITVTV